MASQSYLAVISTRSGERFGITHVGTDDSPINCCVAIGDARGNVIRGSRLTGDFTTCTEAFNALAMLRQTYPSAAVFSSSAERGGAHAGR